MCTVIDALLENALEPTASPPRPKGLCAAAVYWLTELMAPTEQPSPLALVGARKPPLPCSNMADCSGNCSQALRSPSRLRGDQSPALAIKAYRAD
jgi:hypothetical protein